MKFLRPAPIILCLLVLSFYTAPVQGADATSFDPTLVSVEAKSSGGVPVGTIVAWPVATNPSDWDKWLECNGQSISQAVYPELFAVMGGNVPDLRGLFLRGHGGNSADLGVIQEHMVGPHRHRLNRSTGGSGNNWIGNGGGSNRMDWTYDYGENLGEETRPVNTAVRYLIRALL